MVIDERFRGLPEIAHGGGGGGPERRARDGLRVFPGPIGPGGELCAIGRQTAAIAGWGVPAWPGPLGRSLERKRQRRQQ